MIVFHYYLEYAFSAEIVSHVTSDHADCCNWASMLTSSPICTLGFGVLAEPKAPMAEGTQSIGGDHPARSRDKLLRAATTI